MSDWYDATEAGVEGRWGYIGGLSSYRASVVVSRASIRIESKVRRWEVDRAEVGTVIRMDFYWSARFRWTMATGEAAAEFLSIRNSDAFEAALSHFGWPVERGRWKGFLLAGDLARPVKRE